MSTDLEHDTTVTTDLSRTIATLVHKRNPSEVLPTRWHEGAPGTHHVTAVLPDDHCIYRAPHAGLDPVLVVEAFRQAVLLLGHAELGAPAADRQTWMDFEAAFDPEGLAIGPGPTEIDLRMTASDTVRRAGRLASARVQADITADGRPLATAATSFTSQSPAVYARLRGEYADLERSVARAVPLAPPLSASGAGRQDFRDVVLSATNSPTCHQLRVDVTHPGLFDHPVDHVPGMLLLEAVRQAAYTGLGTPAADLVALRCSFKRYTELDSPCWLHSTRLSDSESGDARFSVTAVQNGRPVLAATAALRPHRA
ncbi:ScbA/BarX family gamma-butyrolactone biosynthesis protein [Kitasatospora saccharophila]|uniref:ScbA/BarX family gamma-butyrolactone biosynthesis protein n=1 Tax=Kitasatospora saccharophila TaxID=407973 RepID=A0ABP5JJT0_9ACTN